MKEFFIYYKVLGEPQEFTITVKASNAGAAVAKFLTGNDQQIKITQINELKPAI